MAYLNARDMFDGGGAGRSGDEFEGGPFSAILNALGVKPMGYKDRAAQSAFDAGKPMGTFGGQPARSSYVVPAEPAGQNTPRPRPRPEATFDMAAGAPLAGSQPRMGDLLAAGLPMPAISPQPPSFGPQPLGTAAPDATAVPLMSMPQARVMPAMATPELSLQDYLTMAEMARMGR